MTNRSQTISRSAQVRQSAQSHLASLRQERLRKRAALLNDAGSVQGLDAPSSETEDTIDAAVPEAAASPDGDLTAPDDAAMALDDISADETLEPSPEDSEDDIASAPDQAAAEDPLAEETAGQEATEDEDISADAPFEDHATSEMDETPSAEELEASCDVAGTEVIEEPAEPGAEQPLTAEASDETVSASHDAATQAEDDVAANDSVGAIQPENSDPNADPNAGLNAGEELLQLDGLGTGVVWMFQKAGVTSLQDLADADPEALSASLGLVGQLLDMQHWVNAAKDKL